MEKKQKLVWFAKRCALALAVAALCYLLFGVIGGWCMFRRVTGLPCLTCGMSRAWLCALRLDFAGAFFWHPLFWTVPLIALALIFFGARHRWVRRGLIACLFLFAVVWGGADAFAVSPYPANDRRSRRHSAAPYGCALLNLKREVSFL